MKAQVQLERRALGKNNPKEGHNHNHESHHHHEHGGNQSIVEKVLLWLAIASYLWLAGGLLAALTSGGLGWAAKRSYTGRSGASITSSTRQAA